MSKYNKLTSKFKKSIDSNIYFFLILIFGLFFKLLTIQMIGADGDSGSAWVNAKSLAFGHSIVPGHISTRIGMILPAAIFIKLFGEYPILYYFSPFIFYFVSIIYVFKLIKIITKSDKTAFWAIFLFCLFPNIIEAGNQLKPEIFSIAAISSSLYYFFKYLNQNYKVNDLIISAFLMFYAYISKETNILFMPAVVLIMIFKEKKIKHAVLYSMLLFALFLTETFIYRYLFNAEFGRLSIISSTHLGKDEILQPVKTVFHLFLRFVKVRSFWYPLFLISLPGGIYHFCKEKNNQLFKYYIIINYSFLLLLTFSVKSILPLVPATTFIERYFDVTLPFLFLIFILILKTLVLKILKSNIVVGKKFHIIFVISFMCLSIIVYPILYLKVAYKDLKGGFVENYPLKEVVRINKLLNQAYRNGVPIITPKGVMDRYKKPYQKVMDIIERENIGIEEACYQAGITVEYFKYCEKRVKEGDYKALKSFNYFFSDYDIHIKNGEYRKFENYVINYSNWDYRIIINEKFYDVTEESAKQYFKDCNEYILMDDYPFRAEKVKKP